MNGVNKEGALGGGHEYEGQRHLVSGSPRYAEHRCYSQHHGMGAVKYHLLRVAERLLKHF